MKRIVKVLAVYIMTFIMLFSGVMVTDAKSVLDSNTTLAYLNTIATKLMSTYPAPKYGPTGGEWAIIGLARDGSISKEYAAIYKENLLSSIKKAKGVISEKKYTEYSRVVLALTSIGENPEDFGGYNLIEPICDVDKVKIQGINGIAYALIALDSGNYDNEKGDKGKAAREEYISEILSSQLSNGGWNLSGNVADADMTAICIQALIPYGSSDMEVKSAINSAIDALSEIQGASGAFVSMGTETCESTAQVLVALCEAGISVEDERFVKNGNTVLDGLLAFYKNGSFSHMIGKTKNAIATDQAMHALVSYYRSINNKNRLWDMRDGLEHRVVGEGIKENTNSEQITTKNNNSDKNSQVKEESTTSKKSSAKSNSKSGNKDKLNADTNKENKKQATMTDNENTTSVSETESNEETGLDAEEKSKENVTEANSNAVVNEVVEKEVENNQSVTLAEGEKNTEKADNIAEAKGKSQVENYIKITVLLLIIAASFGLNQLLMWLRKNGKIK